MDFNAYGKLSNAVQKAEKAIFLWLIFDLSFSLSKKNWDKDGSMDLLSDVDHITRGHLSEKNLVAHQGQYISEFA